MMRIVGMIGIDARGHISEKQTLNLQDNKIVFLMAIGSKCVGLLRVLSCTYVCVRVCVRMNVCVALRVLDVSFTSISLCAVCV